MNRERCAEYGRPRARGPTRREHRAWHAHEESVKDGLRKAIKAKDNQIGELLRRVDDLTRDVGGIEIPTPVLGLEINRDGYSADDFTYKVTDADGKDVTSEITTLPAASYDSSSSSVNCDLSALGKLQKGYTYSVTFQVWPSQDAYNLVADLNAGTKTYDGLTSTGYPIR